MAKKRAGGKKASGVGAFGFSLLALIFTGSTAFFLAQTMKGSKYNTTRMKDVVIASRNINASEVLKREFFKVVKFPVGTIPANAFQSIEALFPKENKDQPRVLINKVYQNEVILAERLSNPKQGTGHASRIPANFRAQALEVDRRITKANIVYPGAIVDVLVTMRRPETRDSITKLVVQSVEVLGVNGITDAAELKKHLGSKKARGSSDSISLLVDPDQAESLTLASREGQVDVLLRNSNDSTLIDTQGVSSTELTKSDIEEPVEEPTKAKTKRSSRKRRNRYRRSSRQQRSSRSKRSNSRGQSGRSVKTLELNTP